MVTERKVCWRKYGGKGMLEYWKESMYEKMTMCQISMEYNKSKNINPSI
jgi:hypothetical protein